MNIAKLLAARQNDMYQSKLPTIAFLGDSVTQGCFELYRLGERHSTVFDQKSAYSNRVAEILAMLYPKCRVNIINAGISGDSTKGGLERLERDVLTYKPDLTVVCFGLNDCCGGIEKAERYAERLGMIFDALTEAGSEVIYMTPNMMCTTPSPLTNDEYFKKLEDKFLALQNGGVLDAFIEAGRRVASDRGVRVCDVYAKWKALADNGVNVTALLSNGMNHPTREMHYLFAYSLVEEMMK